MVALSVCLGLLTLVLGAWISVQPWHVAFRTTGALIGLLGLWIAWFAWRFYALPRLAISDSELLVYLRPNFSQAFRVPLDNVEVFFIGQGAVAGEEPGQPKGYEGAVAANVIVRLAESAAEWHHREVHQVLGVWNEGYITIRGLFCDNIDQEVLKVMNKELQKRKRQMKKSSA